MKLVELLDTASRGLADDYLSFYYDDTGNLKSIDDMRLLGDGLAMFIVIGIAETYEADETDARQISEALRVLQSAQGELHHVIQALYERWAEIQ